MISDYGYSPDFLRLTHVMPDRPAPPPLRVGKQYSSRQEMKECKDAEKEMGITKLNRGKNYAI